MLLIGLVILSLSRFALVAWQWDRVEAAAIPASLFVQGLRADLILLGYFEVLPLLLAPLLAYRSSDAPQLPVKAGRISRMSTTRWNPFPVKKLRILSKCASPPYTNSV